MTEENKPRRSFRIPLLVLAGFVFGLLCFLGIRSLIPSGSSSNDQSIVQQGTYPDICPGRTVEELLAHGHAEVQWTSYLNKYGYRSVQAVCLDANQTPRAVLIWTIDDQEKFWIQFALKDGDPLQPYDLLAILCQAMPADPVPPASPSP